MPAMNRPGFLTKAGLRRLLTSDEVWSFGRKRSSGEQIQTEQETLQQTPGSKDSCDPKRFLAYGHRSQPCHHASAERKAKSEDGKSSHQHEPSKADSKLHGCEHENTQSSSHKGPHHEKLTSPKSSDIHSGDKMQYPAEVTWKPVKNVQHFTSRQHNQTSCGITDRAPIVSSLSSDLEEDLPYDYEDSHKKPKEQRETKLQEVLKTYSASEDISVDCGQAITDNATLNVENDQRLQTVLLLNNNHEICSESRKSESNTAFTRIWQNTKESVMDKPLIANLVQTLSSDLKRGEESPSCDDSLSETEDKSEPFSLQSEAFAWSEEEKDVFNEEKTEASTCSLGYTEKFTMVPEPSLYYYQSSNKHNELGCHDASHYERDMTMECTLSEILSPVDEVLSYGSAELPPSVKGGGSSGPNSTSLPPPPPAFEIITWTSEEDLPAPPDVEDVSINSENFPNLPVDLYLCRKETNSLRESLVNNSAGIGDGCKTISPALATGQDAEDECSEYTGFLPVDESNETEDALSAFQIGDRVLVCNSRPGVLKYKGLTAFAGGFWAGVALDTPSGNHNGTFRGVKYFTCEKNHGVLVRAEDVIHLHRKHCGDLKTGLDEDSLSDEDPSDGRDGKNGNKPSGNGQGRNQDSQSSHGHDPSAPKQTCQPEPCEIDVIREMSKELSNCLKFSEQSPLKNKHLVEEPDVLIERLTEEIFADALKSVQETRKRHRRIIRSKQENKPIDSGFRKRENSGFTANKPCLMDQWRQVYPKTPPQIRVQPHEHSIVYRVVDATVELHYGRADAFDKLDACETPSYLVDDKSRKGYRQVLFQFASDILHEVCANILEMRSSVHETKDMSVTSALETGQISLTYLKAAVKREAQKVLNLERTDQQMTEILQALCKYWYAKRDQVDYILIQELHCEERQWVDYSTDQLTVKMQVAEDIFGLLLDDTISVLNRIYVSGHK